MIRVAGGLLFWAALIHCGGSVSFVDLGEQTPDQLVQVAMGEAHPRDSSSRILALQLLLDATAAIPCESWSNAFESATGEVRAWAMLAAVTEGSSPCVRAAIVLLNGTPESRLTEAVQTIALAWDTITSDETLGRALAQVGLRIRPLSADPSFLDVLDSLLDQVVRAESLQALIAELDGADDPRLGYLADLALRLAEREADQQTEVAKSLVELVALARIEDARWIVQRTMNLSMAGRTSVVEAALRKFPDDPILEALRQEWEPASGTR